MGQKGFSSERKIYHLRIWVFFFDNYIFIGFPCYVSYIIITDLEGWPEAPALHSSSPHCIFTLSSVAGGIPHLQLQAQFGDLAYALVSLPVKVRVVQIPLTVEHGLQNFAMDLLQTRRKKKSKLDSEALEWKAEIQIKCKVSRRFAGIWQYNKWQPTSGQCLSVQEDKAKSQSWIMCLGFFFFISGDVEILTFSSEVFEFQNGWSLSVIQKLGSKKKEIKRNRKALDVNCYLFKM